MQEFDCQLVENPVTKANVNIGMIVVKPFFNFVEGIDEYNFVMCIRIHSLLGDGRLNSMHLFI